MKSIVFIDSEIGVEDKKIKDIGAVKADRTTFHSQSVRNFYAFISDSDFICGHNLIHHDLKYLVPYLEKGVSRILCKLKNAVQIEQIYSKGAARKSAVPFAVILAVNLPYVKDQ